MAVWPDQRVEQLGETECWGRLLGAQLGRLAFDGRESVEILPLNYVLRGPYIVFRTTAGAAVPPPQRRPVSFEVDGWNTHTAWSVIAHGRSRRSRDADVAARETANGLPPWAPEEVASGSEIAELVIDRVSGREFARRTRSSALWYW